MVLPVDWMTKTGNDLRKMETALVTASRALHEHIRHLEFAVEGKYAHQMDDPRVSLLSDALRIQRSVDHQLAQLNLNMQRILRDLQKQEGESTAVRPSNIVNVPVTSQTDNTPAPPKATRTSIVTPLQGTFEQERAELATNIINLRQERNELETLYDIARTLNSTLEFDEVLRLVMDRVIQFVDAERGFLMLVNDKTGEPYLALGRDRNAQTIPDQGFEHAAISRKTIQQVISTRQPVLTDDTKTDDKFKAHESVVTYDIRSIMCAPLVVRDHCIGAVYVDCRFTAKLFEPKHREMLLAFCNQAAIAIDNARLFAELNQAIQQVQADKQYMDNIFGSIANGVITTDSNGLITTFNDAASIILCMDPEQVKGQHYEKVFAPLAHIGLTELLQSASFEHQHGTLLNSSIEDIIPGREKEGTVSLTFYVSSLRDMDNTDIGMALVIDDRTELERSKARTKQIQRIFEKYVHPKVVEELIQNPMALNLGGETKEISVVFADIRGYTRLSENMPPHEVMDLINRYHKIMCDAIWEEEGTITSFQGDAVMAIFNAPLQQKNHAIRAVRAAWKMRLAMQEYQRSLPQEKNVAYGIGVNTGLATVGNIGASDRLQNYTAIGDVVNVASRLQNNVTDNNILLNDTTYIQVYRYVQVGPPFALQVKNKKAPLIAREVIGLL